MVSRYFGFGHTSWHFHSRALRKISKWLDNTMNVMEEIGFAKCEFNKAFNHISITAANTFKKYTHVLGDTLYHFPGDYDHLCVGHISPCRLLLELVLWWHFFKSSQCNPSEDRAPVDFIYGCPIFEWVAVTCLTERAPEYLLDYIRYIYQGNSPMAAKWDAH